MPFTYEFFEEFSNYPVENHNFIKGMYRTFQSSLPRSRPRGPTMQISDVCSLLADIKSLHPHGQRYVGLPSSVASGLGDLACNVTAWSPAPSSEETHFPSLLFPLALDCCTFLIQPKVRRKSQRTFCFLSGSRRPSSWGTKEASPDKALPNSSVERRQSSSGSASTCSKLLLSLWKARDRLDLQRGREQHIRNSLPPCLATNSRPNTDGHKCFSILIKAHTTEAEILLH